jgi:predicted HTH transcriptional regulator
VDYKSQAVTAKDFGKDFSSFANQYGGWLFVGVEEGPGKSLRAGSFPGIPDDKVGEALVRIREGVSAHVSPFVYFEHRIIQGPVEEIALESGRSIIVVYVPEGVNPPFVHSSGKRYRRVGDSSEPKAETDRSVLDGMWKKSDQTTTALQEFILGPTCGG